jgi:hypothetical protein
MPCRDGTAPAWSQQGSAETAGSCACHGPSPAGGPGTAAAHGGHRIGRAWCGCGPTEASRTASTQAATRDQRLEALRNRAEMLSQRLSEVNARIEELETESD